MAGLLVIALVALLLGLAIRADPLVYLFYALVGTYIANQVWLRQARAAVRGERHVGTGQSTGPSDTSAFLGDRVPVSITVRNSGWLPAAWAVVEEALPASLRAVQPPRWAMTLASRESTTLAYELYCARRGYYPLGPLTLRLGTPWEAGAQEKVLAPADYLTVYPHIVPLNQLGLPSRLPLGARQTRTLLLPDPSRLVGVRDYQPGDRLRDIHWRATARTGQLQVKKFEPSKPLQVVVFLDLDAGAYDFRTRDRASELAIVVAASLAADVVNQRQAVGLICNGRDPLAEARSVDVTAPRPPGPVNDGAPPSAVPPEPDDIPPSGLGWLEATDRLVARTVAPRTAPRRLALSDPLDQVTLPEETYDEEASAFIDGPASARPPARPVALPIHDGPAHLSQLLGVLARIVSREAPTDTDKDAPAPALPFARLVRRRSAGLPWGTTIVLICAAPTDALIPTMLGLRHAGFSPLAVFVQPPRIATDLDASALRAAHLPAYDVYDEAMLAHLQLGLAG